MIKYYFLFFCFVATAILLSCNNNSEIENTSADLNKDSTQVNNGKIEVSANKFILKSSEQEAVMEWPEINGDVSRQALDKMNAAISIDTVCGESIKEIQLNYKNCSCGTVGSIYKVNHNKNNILSLSISIETMGAYPDGFIRNYNFNTRTGAAISIDSLIKKDSLPSLIKKLNSELTKRIEESKAIAEEDAERSEDTESINNLFDRTAFSIEDVRNFVITDKGIIFYFEFGFPHVAQALEPAGDFFISKEDLSSYLFKGIML